MERATQRTHDVIEHRRLPLVSDTGASRLAEELAKHVRGEVRFDDGYRALYATDASNYRQVPIGVVLPRDVNDAIVAVAICRSFGAPIVNRGGGTSLAGQACNSAVVLDSSKYVNDILEIDPEQRSARVEPGVVLDDLRARAEEYHLTFGPDPATHDHCTLGGMIGNNACGVHAIMAGCTAANVQELDVLTYSGMRLTVGATSWSELERDSRAGGRRGELFRQIRKFIDRHREAIREGFPDIPRRVSGYNLPALLEPDGPHLARALVGSEGTLVTVLSAKLRLVPSPPARALLVLGYPSIFEAADHIMEVRESRPIGLEGIDDVLVEDMKRKRLHPERIELLPEGRGWLLVELGAETPAEADARARALMSRLAGARRAPSMKLFDDPEEAHIIWKVRESGLGATARVPGDPDTWEGWEDAAVAPERLGGYLRRFGELLDRHGYRAALYGHFGQGCVHTRIPFDLKSSAGVARFRAFVEEAADLVVAHGGSLSGEHGDGQARAELLPRMFRPELMRALEEWKAIWDPGNKMNPGKVVRPRRLDEDLRLGPGYHPRAVTTHFQFPDDRGSFGYATERCVGVGECRKLDGGTMCPSYMVTREEMHSTRGRARLLFEMLRGGDGLAGGWRSEPVRDALDLCLSCKACKSECPVEVDMATYKAEFLAHYYEGRLRPRAAYALALMPWWARVASLFPALVNLVVRLPVLSGVLKWIAGIDARQQLPRFAHVTFRAWWDRRAPAHGDGPRVLLWVDTWCDHFQPAIPIAAVEVLESAGYRVVVSPPLCCGRPLYDWGMLDRAKRMLRRILDALAPALRDGVPIVGLEPSCVSVFRDELPNLFPDDPDAHRLKDRAFMLGDFLAREARDWKVPHLRRRALVQGHCHHKSVLGLKDELPLFRRMGLSAHVLDAGCCGIAGAFGYERGHYEVSVACAERQLAPAVRRAREDEIIIADGFSCREQIAHRTGRRALHTAQVLQMAKQQGPLGPSGPRPERGYADVRLPVPWTRQLRNATLLGVMAWAGWRLLRASRRP